MTTEVFADPTVFITRELVPEVQRADFVDALFGIAYPLQLEPTVFEFASRLSPTYRGAYWNMYALSNGGWYMCPDEDNRFDVRCPNGYQGSLTADAFGIVTVLYAFSHLSFIANGDAASNYVRHYHLLREFAAEHEEAAAIFAAID